MCVGGVKVKSGFTRIESRWIRCGFPAHGNGERGLNATKEPVGLKTSPASTGLRGGLR